MISINQRIGDQSKLNSMIVDEALKDVRVCVPAIIDSFDPITQTVECQIAITERLINKDDNTYEDVQISKLVDVPIVIPQIGSYSLTMPIKRGDECLVIFSDLCYNSWWANGGIGNQEELRRHDLSDGFAIIGIKSQPNVIEKYSTDSMQLRNKSGQTYVEIKDNIINIITDNEVNVTAKNNVNVKAKDVNVEATNNVDVKATKIIATATSSIEANAPTIKATGTLVDVTASNVNIKGETAITGNTTINGNLSVNGDINVSGRASVGSLTVGGIEFMSHRHSNGNEGADTGGVV